MSTADLATLILAARKAAGLTQEDVAAALGITRQSVQQWETGKTGPKRSLVPKLAALLKIDPSAIDPLSFAKVRLAVALDQNVSLILIPVQKVPYTTVKGIKVIEFLATVAQSASEPPPVK